MARIIIATREDEIADAFTERVDASKRLLEAEKNLIKMEEEHGVKASRFALESYQQTNNAMFLSCVANDIDHQNAQTKIRDAQKELKASKKDFILKSKNLKNNYN